MSLFIPPFYSSVYYDDNNKWMIEMNKIWIVVVLIIAQVMLGGCALSKRNDYISIYGWSRDDKYIINRSMIDKANSGSSARRMALQNGVYAANDGKSVVTLIKSDFGGGFDTYLVQVVSDQNSIVRSGRLTVNPFAIPVGLVEVRVAKGKVPEALLNTWILGIVVYADDKHPDENLSNWIIRTHSPTSNTPAMGNVMVELVDWYDDGVELFFGHGNLYECEEIEFRSFEPNLHVNHDDNKWKIQFQGQKRGAEK